MAQAALERPLLTIRETADRLALSEKSVRRLIAGCALPAVKVGGSLRVLPDELEEWVRKQSVSGVPRLDPAERRAPELVPAVEAQAHGGTTEAA